MYLYLLKSRDASEYDAAPGLVVAARSENEARLLAAHDSGVEGADEWCDIRRSTCWLIGETCYDDALVEKSQVVLRGFPKE